MDATADPLGGGAFAIDLTPEGRSVRVGAVPTALTYTGASWAVVGDTLHLSVVLDAGSIVCRVYKWIEFRVADEHGTVCWVGALRTDLDGRAGVSVDTTGWPEGAYSLSAHHSGWADVCAGSEAVAILTLAP